MIKRLLILSGALALVAGRAHAFRTASDQPQFAGTTRVRWANSAISYGVSTDIPPGLTQEDVEAVAVRATGRWSATTCSDVVFGSVGRRSEPAAAGDGVNTIQFLKSGWTSRGFDPTAAGITDVQYEKDDQGEWAIVEADIYLNADNFSWVAS